MPRDGTQTREHIVARAADVFSTQGFHGASMRDLLAAMGVQKGGLYNHFGSKQQLALEAFDYAVDLVAARYAEALPRETTAIGRLRAVIDVLRSLVDEPLLPGGCPILNTAVECDDTNPALRDRARAAMGEWQRMIGRIVSDGVAAGELVPGTDPRAVATVLTASLEGAVMLSKLYADNAPMERVTAHLHDYVDGLAGARTRRSRP